MCVCVCVCVCVCLYIGDCPYTDSHQRVAFGELLARRLIPRPNNLYYLLAGQHQPRKAVNNAITQFSKCNCCMAKCICVCICVCGHMCACMCVSAAVRKK